MINWSIMFALFEAKLGPRGPFNLYLVLGNNNNFVKKINKYSNARYKYSNNWVNENSLEIHRKTLFLRKKISKNNVYNFFRTYAVPFIPLANLSSTP